MAIKNPRKDQENFLSISFNSEIIGNYFSFLDIGVCFFDLSAHRSGEFKIFRDARDVLHILGISDPLWDQ